MSREREAISKAAKVERDRRYKKLGEETIKNLSKINLSDYTFEEIYAARISGASRFEFLEIKKCYPYTAGVYFLFNEAGKMIRTGQSIDVFDRIYKHCAPDYINTWCSVSILIFSNTPSEIELNFTESHFIYQHQNENSRYDSSGKLNAPCRFDALMRLEAAGIQSKIMPYLSFLNWENVLPKTDRVKSPRTPKQKISVNWNLQLNENDVASHI